LKVLGDFVIGGAFFPACRITQPEHQLHVLEHVRKVIALQVEAIFFGEIRANKVAHELLFL